MGMKESKRDRGRPQTRYRDEVKKSPKLALQDYRRNKKTSTAGPYEKSHFVFLHRNHRRFFSCGEITKCDLPCGPVVLSKLTPQCYMRNLFKLIVQGHRRNQQINTEGARKELM